MARVEAAAEVDEMATGVGGSVIPEGVEAATGRPSITISLVVPTRNEAPNVFPLLRRCRSALAGIASEVIFADDSDDGTAAAVEAAQRHLAGDGFDVHLVHRSPAERTGGLGGAVVAGVGRASGTWVCVLDGDLQHPPEAIVDLHERAMSGDRDLVIATRYSDGGDPGGLASPVRAVVSKAAGHLATMAFRRTLAGVSDPMSGFFLFRRTAVDLGRLEPDGYKILLEILVRTPGLRVAEVPFTFRERQGGESKAVPAEGFRYIRHVARLRRAAAAAVEQATRCYDVHGIITVESEGHLPELEWFRVPSLSGPADVTVRVGPLPADAPASGPSSRGPRHLRYSELAGNRGFAADLTLDGDRVEVTAAPLIARSPHVLYTNLVEPILRWELVKRGYALTHGACVVDDGRAYLITARTDTGKTTTMLKLLESHPLDFIADDLTVLSPDGQVLPYPKPLTISQHTLHAVKRARLGPWERAVLPLQSRLHSRSGRRFAFLLTRTGLPVATTNTIVQMLVPPPKYPVQRLVPGVEVASGGSLCGMFVIQRGGEGDEDLEADDALEILLRNCEDAYGFPPYHDLEAFLLGATGRDLRAVEREIMAAALEQRPSTLMGSTTLDWATRIPRLIARLNDRAATTVIELPPDGAAEAATFDVPLIALAQSD